MKYFKVIRFLKHDGNADYKGLDINQFVGMSQQYDFENGFCVIATTQTENLPESEELVELDENNYRQLFNTINDILKNQKPTQEDIIRELKTQIDDLTIMLCTALLGGAIQ